MDKRLKTHQRAYGGGHLDEDLKEREEKFQEQLDKISTDLYPNIIDKSMPLSRRVELVKMRWNAKAEAFTDWLSQEIFELKDMAEKIERKEEAKLKHFLDRTRNIQKRFVSKILFIS